MKTVLMFSLFILAQIAGAQTDPKETLSRLLQLRDIPVLPSVPCNPLHEMPEPQQPLFLSWQAATFRIETIQAPRLYMPMRRSKLIHKL